MIGEKVREFSVLDLINNREQSGELLVIFWIRRLKTTESRKSVRLNHVIDSMIRLFTDENCSLYSKSSTGDINFKSGSNLEYCFKTVVNGPPPPCSLLVRLIENKEDY